MLKRLLLVAALLPAPALAHFGLILPPVAMLEKGAGRSLEVTFAFLHPFAQFGMDMAAPEAVVMVGPDGTETDLASALAPAEVLGKPAFTAEVPFGRPGAYTLGMTPAPYWEPAEDAFIIHYTKTYVAAFGDDSGWDRMLGLPVEIEPLTRPLGLWEGNVFQGVVRRDGAPVPFAEVEVEHWNTGGVAAPSELMVTQTVRADGNGVFSYAPPGPGWWGFAALVEADYTLPRDGQDKAVELGGVLWVHFEDWP